MLCLYFKNHLHFPNFTGKMHIFFFPQWRPQWTTVQISASYTNIWFFEITKFQNFVHFLDEQLYWLNFECQCALLQRTGLALYSFVKMCCKVHSQQKHITNSKVSRNPDPADPLVNHLPSYSYILFVILNYNGIIGIAYLQEYRT